MTTQTYKIVRHYQRSSEERETIATGLSIEEAQEHCSDLNSSSKGCVTTEGVRRTTDKGPWFDGYYQE